MWCKNVGTSFCSFVTNHVFVRWTDSVLMARLRCMQCMQCGKNIVSKYTYGWVKVFGGTRLDTIMGPYPYPLIVLLHPKKLKFQMPVGVFYSFTVFYFCLN